MESWLESHDVILQQLFEWLLPPLLACTATCRLAAAISPLNLVQGSLELFQVLLQEALPNLKERKYLRGWIQAGVVYACVWSLGGCLADEGERAKFDQGIREVLNKICDLALIDKDEFSSMTNPCIFQGDLWQKD